MLNSEERRALWLEQIKKSHKETGNYSRVCLAIGIIILLFSLTALVIDITLVTFNGDKT